MERVFSYFLLSQNAGRLYKTLLIKKINPFLLKISDSGLFSRSILWYIASGRKNIEKSLEYLNYIIIQNCCYVKFVTKNPVFMSNYYTIIDAISLLNQTKLNVYPQIIVDVPKVSLNQSELDYLSRTGQLRFLRNSSSIVESCIIYSINTIFTY